MKKIIGSVVLVLTLMTSNATTQSFDDNHKKKKNSGVASSVEVLSFKGQVNAQKSIDLSCTIESNCDYNVVVERSKNGKKFQQVGVVSDDQSISNFVVTDNDYNATNYYRLKMIDNQGTVSYSKLMVVQMYDHENISMVNVTPNTPEKNIHANIELKNRAFVTIIITDEDGKEVLQRKQVSEAGLNEFELTGTNALAKGNYHMQILVNGKQHLSLPLIKDEADFK